MNPHRVDHRLNVLVTVRQSIVAGCQPHAAAQMRRDLFRAPGLGVLYERPRTAKVTVVDNLFKKSARGLTKHRSVFRKRPVIRQLL
jgi:hypothetical protein